MEEIPAKRRCIRQSTDLQSAALPTAAEGGQRAAQPAAQLAIHPAAQRAAQLAAEPAAQRAVQLAAEPAAQRAAHPAAQRAVQLAAEPAAQRAVQLAAEPAAQRAAHPAAQRAVQLAAEPAAQRAVQLAAEPAAQRAAQRAVQLAAELAAQRAAHPAAQRAVQLAAEPAAQRAAHPAAQRAVQLAAEPAAQRAVQLAAEPAAQRAAHPAAQRAVQLAAEPAAQRAVQLAAEPAAQRAAQRAVQLAAELAAQRAAHPAAQRAVQLAAELAAQRAVQLAAEPAAQRAAHPAAQRAVQLAAEPAAQRAVQLAAEPAAQRAANPADLPAAQRAANPAAQPVDQPAAEPSTLGIILNAVFMVMETSSSESDDEEDDFIRQRLSNSDPFPYEFYLFSERNPRNAVRNYVEETVPTYTEKEFRTHFRITRSLFENLCQQLVNWDVYKSLRADKRRSERVHLLVFLWFAGHEACSFRDLADRFNLSLWSIHTIIQRVSMFLSCKSPDVIKWPNEQQKEGSSKFFDKKCLFSKAIGCIDGTHIVIDPPTKGKDDYIDRKGNTTICLQAICDENKKFINVFVGYPGSSHDSWILQNSPIYSKLPSYCGDYYLLGDSAYPCNKYLVTPYRDNGHLTRAQKHFNIKLSSGRVGIEHTFGIFKQRFRQLYYCKLRGIKRLCHFVRACCVLHNIANEDDLQFTAESTPIVDNEFPEHGEVPRGNCVRDAICEDIQRREAGL